MKKRYFASPTTPVFTIRHDDNGMVYIMFSDAARHNMAAEFAYRGYIASDENAWISHLKSKIIQILGTWGIETLSALSTGSAGEGVVVFDNLPYEQVDWSPLPGTPAHSAKNTSLSEHLLLAIAALLGEPYGVASEGRRLVNDLIPSQADRAALTGNGSEVKLGLHTENAAHRFIAPGRDFSPKGLLLTGVSQQHCGGPTTPVAMAARAIKQLPGWAVDVLRQPCARIALPVRHRQAGASATAVGPVPVIIGPPGRESVIAAFYGDMMQPVSADAAYALDRLAQALNAVAVALKIVPGRLVYIANGPALHGRSDFVPVFDNNNRAQRWLQRVFVTGRLDAFFETAALTDRVFDLTIAAIKAA